MSTDANAVQIECRDADTVSVSGALTFATAAAAWRSAESMLSESSPHKLDLSGLTEADSAGLACVLAMLARGQSKRPEMQVQNAPPGLRALARVCDAEAWLD